MLNLSIVACSYLPDDFAFMNFFHFVCIAEAKKTLGFLHKDTEHFNPVINRTGV